MSEWQKRGVPMRNDHDRDAQRQVYRQPSMGEKVFIPAKPKIDIYGSERIFRVCAYCRVSTDNDAQLSSFELQQAHYRQLNGRDDENPALCKACKF